MQPEAPDQELQADVMDALFREMTNDATEIGVMTERGIVTLSGRVFNEPQRRLAQATALAVAGVGAVVDDLLVKPLGSVDEDVRIARAARDALDWAAGVPDDRIKVIVHNGRVRLEGIVERSDERDAAAAAVCGLLGEASVENAIVVRLSRNRAGSEETHASSSHAKAAVMQPGRTVVEPAAVNPG